MADKTCGPRDVPTVFVIPEEAHFDLIKLREHVRMMARLSEPGVVAPYGCVVHPHAMHFSYMTIWRTLDESIDATYWSADHAIDIEEAHIRAAAIRERNAALRGTEEE